VQFLRNQGAVTVLEAHKDVILARSKKRKWL
jgi:hypothetical protein